MLDIQRRRAQVLAGIVFAPTRFDAAGWFRTLALAAVGMTLLTLGMLALDGRSLDGEPVWLKPFKFSISFAVFFATLAITARRLSRLWRSNWIVIAAALLSGAAFLFEMAYIGAQAARQEHSHFNEGTPFHELMYSLMGTGATTLMLTVALVGFAAWMDKDARLSPHLRAGIALGFAATVVLTFWVAGELAGNGGRYVGMPTPGGPTLPLVGWSMEVGDLRPAHFFSLHAMQALPLVGLAASRLDLTPRVVWIAALLYASFTVMIFLTALHGIPLISA